MNVIPEEAIEAAAQQLFLQHSRSNGPDLVKIWREDLSLDLKEQFISDARAALGVTAPLLMAQAWDEGFSWGLVYDPEVDPDGRSFPPNPFRS